MKSTSLDDCLAFTIRSFVPAFILASKLRLCTQPFKSKMNFIHYVIPVNLQPPPCFHFSLCDISVIILLLTCNMGPNNVYFLVPSFTTPVKSCQKHNKFPFDTTCQRVLITKVCSKDLSVLL